MPEILPPAQSETQIPATTPTQNISRIALGAMLIFAGISHLTFARKPFRAQVPPWVPIDPDTVVLQSGVVEIALGATIAFAPPRRRALIGLLAGGFFAAVFPGNIAQYQHHRSAFGLDTDQKRFARLFFQPLLIAWAVWSTGAFPKKPSQLPSDSLTSSEL
jgi:uncharacterized membrane protein